MSYVKSTNWQDKFYRDFVANEIICTLKMKRDTLI